MNQLLCRIFGHRLETGVHAKEATLWCSRCKRIVWWYHAGNRMILHSDATNADITRLGLSRQTGARTDGK